MLGLSSWCLLTDVWTSGRSRRRCCSAGFSAGSRAGRPQAKRADRDRRGTHSPPCNPTGMALFAAGVARACARESQCARTPRALRCWRACCCVGGTARVRRRRRKMKPLQEHDASRSVSGAGARALCTSEPQDGRGDLGCSQLLPTPGRPDQTI
ncbi:hypothetical protein K458DRAFT_181672 [Lentithecium fluviatile CBS 122367]|uniref:Uncharacterized protein n=1 Tax=Lentithecium fluviatile CBS 122367 TaxID=1168545 RepID=A0A6G1IEB0_9PLEO|nr:hypothetical protein K458DRAFT_181672 [Lentithecium fluviatile CBS 122367]